MQQQVINVLILGACFLALFGLCELLYYKRRWQAEQTRKLAHAGSGLLALTFPFFFHDFYWVLGLSLVFFIILALSKKVGMMRSIHGIARVSYGSAMFPLVVIICFWFYAQSHSLLHFYLPILVMALADPAACLIGKKLPIKKLYKKKTLGGSLAFFLVAFSLTLGFSVIGQPDFEIGKAVLKACLVALATTTAEVFTNHGFDNLTIPLAALLAM